MRASCRAVPVLLVSLSLGLLLAPRPGGGVPLYAARTGLACQTCHFDPNGGGPRNEFGFGYAKNRHMIAAEEEGSPWADLALVNRVGENLPLYFGVNQRFMLISNQHTLERSPERLAFFNMENAIHLAFQPHSMLTMVYTLDAFASGSASGVRSKEAFGMIGAPSLGGYLKAGRFRVPFGLRMDDHTVATRSGFLDFGNEERLLPYDPRQVDMGVELGAEHRGWTGRLALTNGTRTYQQKPDPHLNATSARIGYSASSYQGGVSYYQHGSSANIQPPDDWRYKARWGYYGLARYRGWVLLGEVAAGNDILADRTRTLLAAFGELDYAPWRWANFRARYDFQELDRGSKTALTQNSYRRYSLEGEFVPVPFAELRWTCRYIDPKDPAQDDERQAYLQFHFSY